MLRFAFAFAAVSTATTAWAAEPHRVAEGGWSSCRDARPMVKVDTLPCWREVMFQGRNGGMGSVFLADSSGKATVSLAGPVVLTDTGATMTILVLRDTVREAWRSGTGRCTIAFDPKTPRRLASFLCDWHGDKEDQFWTVSSADLRERR